jgi:hypothetical protein
MPITTTPREQALALLQTIDRHGAYTDAASADEDREPCSLAEAIRAVATVIEGAIPSTYVPPELAELFGALALWAWDEQHARPVTTLERHKRWQQEAAAWLLTAAR